MAEQAARRVDGQAAPRARPRSTTARIDDLFERQWTSGADLPDPEPLVRNLARCAIEILAGARDLEQISRWLEPELHARLAKRVAISARARWATGRTAARPTMVIGTCRIDSPADGVVEAVVVAHLAARARAVSIRLIGIDGRWRATELSVL